MMDVAQIKNIESLVRLDADTKILNYTVKRLTAPGENYGSLMLRVDATVTGNKEIHLVAKMLPPNQFLQDVFNSKVTFRNEIGFYKNVFPALINFQKGHGVKKVIDFAPRYFGSRLNLADDDAEVDEDAALVLENLKVEDYVVLDCKKGLDLDVSKFILEDLAQMHALAIALKLEKPDVFEKSVKPYLSPWKAVPEHFEKLVKDLVRLIDQTPALQPSKTQILKEFERQMEVREPREPFATITHNDCWTNNNLLKFEDGKPVNNKIVDYQICSYGSPARDVLFFIFSSVKAGVITQHYDELIKFYHDRFITTLKEVKCDTKQFSLDAFLEELEYEAKNSQFAHVAFMLFPIFAERENVKEVEEMTPDNLIPEDVSDLLKEASVFFVNEFVKRKWIYN